VNSPCSFDATITWAAIGKTYSFPRANSLVPFSSAMRSRRRALWRIVGVGAPPANRGIGNRNGCPTGLLERKFDSFFLLASYEFVSLNNTGAGIPP
jgi:hypothetical protein